jgi:hypothetical protein
VEEKKEHGDEKVKEVTDDATEVEEVGRVRVDWHQSKEVFG